jgi:Kef-type K+ transport system membrane component KefB
VLGLVKPVAIAAIAIPDVAWVGIPPIARRVRLPEMIGLLLFGVQLGSHGLEFFGTQRPIADFFAELGAATDVLGLEIDVEQFRKAQTRAISLNKTHKPKIRAILALVVPVSRLIAPFQPCPRWGASGFSPICFIAHHRGFQLQDPCGDTCAPRR